MPGGTRTARQFRGYMTEAEVRMPPYQKTEPEKPEMVEEMYPIRWPPYDNSDVEKRIGGILGPLSLFAPYPHENAPDTTEEIVLERPVTPINEEVKSKPASFDQLAQFVRRRIAAHPAVPHLSMEDQRNLAGILMGEVNGIWPDIRKQIDDPFLSPSENRELNRRIAVHIVTVCEQLFKHYLEKAQVLNSRGIFSGPANMSRLKAQLSLDANKFLNILMIRRYIVADMRGKGDTDSVDSEEFIYVTEPTKAKQAHPELSFKGMIETSRPKSKTKRFRYHTPEQEAKEITANMPSLDTRKLMDLISTLPDRELETPSQGTEVAPSRISEHESKSSGVSKEEASMEKVMLKRSRSLPQLQVGETLMEELGIVEDVRKDELFRYEIEILKRQTAEKPKDVPVVVSKEPQPGTREYAADDLYRLVTRPQDIENVNVEEDLPPLLQAITRSAKHDGKKKLLDKQLQELEEKERLEQEKLNIPLREPTHPQPATVKAKLGNQMVVRASDVRVSERVCMSSITLARYATVYNDLTEEIDPGTVKYLDRNLFLGEEIKEVYKEIMKTVPGQHLELDDDPTVVTAAETVNLSGTLSSATLSRKKSERVINPSLQKEDRNPPWGEMAHKQWVRTPMNPPKNFQGEDIFAPMTPNMDRVHEVMHNPSKMSQLMSSDNLPTFVAEKMARTYASWLQWWKSTITSDDYMKYLSTQESDYLGVVFHFYDDEEDEDYLETPIPSGPGGVYKVVSRNAVSSKMAVQKEKEKKLEELKTQKTEYKEGFWNVNTILLGGLGKEPIIEEEEDDSSSKGAKSADTTRSTKTLKERAAARHSAKLQEKDKDKSPRDTSHSRASKGTSVTGSKMDTERSETSDGLEAPLTPQDRLERVWGHLEMPDALKLDMAIKYSSNEFYMRLTEVIERWERTTEIILKRENFLAKLEKFERNASDPNRFFEKGQKGSSSKRLQEARQRSFYYKRIESMDAEIKAELAFIREHFADIITYKGRPYQDKMKWDRIEMLYWLQEERKEHAIKYEAMMRHIPLKSAHLDPIPAVNVGKA